MKKDHIKLLLKAALGAGLIYYVLHSKMVDFHSLQAVLLRPSTIITALIFLTVSMLCCAIRWNLLVKTQGLSLSMVDLIELTMIGMFFNSFMPGSVGGDIIKAWYAAGQEPRRKTKAVFTVILDRAIGLWVILSASSFAVLLYPQWLVARPELRILAAAVWAFTGGGIAVGILFFLSDRWQLPGTAWASGQLRRSRRIGGLIDTAMLHRESIPRMIAALILSTTSVISAVLLFKFLGDSLGIDMPLSVYFFVVPLALTVSAVPVLPGGLGVGQVAFFQLFKWVGVADPGQGSTVCTLFQIYTLLFNCIGAIFYLKFKKKPDEASPADGMTSGDRTAAPRREESQSAAVKRQVSPQT